MKEIQSSGSARRMGVFALIVVSCLALLVISACGTSDKGQVEEANSPKVERAPEPAKKSAKKQEANKEIAKADTKKDKVEKKAENAQKDEAEKKQPDSAEEQKKETGDQEQVELANAFPDPAPWSRNGVSASVPASASASASAEATTEEASAEATTEEASAEATTEEASAEATTEEASAEATTEEASAEATTEEASAEATTEEASAEATTEEASAEATTEEASAEASAEATTDEASALAAAPSDTTMSLSVPAIGLNVPVYEGTGEGSLEAGTGHLSGTGYPWIPGSNTYIAGHRVGYPGTASDHVFWDLPSLGVGDEVILTDANGTSYTYAVSEILEVPITELSVTAPVGRDVVSLQTCIEDFGDYWTAGPDWNVRYVVRADKVA